ncbi:MAG: hypothetical protein JWO13_514 [Acidobacteriales bacterium]|nr:hypothetical protein [Terriglobales bacterium]
MAFPDLPHPGYSWRLNHHMGILTAEHLYHILWAANEFSRNADPATDINNYLIANQQFTANVREDTGQPDAWRDYQQVLSELGLTYSLEVVPQITLTPLGLALLDGSMGFTEIITLQALRFQYPNGHHVAISTTQRTAIEGTPLAAVRTFTELQHRSGILIRPSVLAWRVLRGLSQAGAAPSLTVDEFETYVMRCSTNGDHAPCVAAIVAARNGGVRLPRQGLRQRRNAQDWLKFLGLTEIFTVIHEGRSPFLEISAFGNEHAQEISHFCAALEIPSSFWTIGTVSQADRLRWYSEYGGVDLSIPELPEAETPAVRAEREFVAGEEQDDELPGGNLPEGGAITLTPFEGVEPPANPPANRTIESVYNAELTRSAHRLHDQMVLLIAQTCRDKGADVFSDRNTVDLLVRHQQQEFIIEVKSITPKNFIARLRCGLGQVLHYDFLRSTQTHLPRRKVIALAANVPANSWSIRFLNNHVDTDLLTLESGRLRVFSDFNASSQLFG